MKRIFRINWRFAAFSVAISLASASAIVLVAYSLIAEVLPVNGGTIFGMTVVLVLMLLGLWMMSYRIEITNEELRIRAIWLLNRVRIGSISRIQKVDGSPFPYPRMYEFSTDMRERGKGVLRTMSVRDEDDLWSTLVKLRPQITFSAEIAQRIARDAGGHAGD